jgi:hypothetical protein
MPYHWAKFPSSPPLERRAEVARICRRHGGSLVGRQTYYGADGSSAYALIKLPDDAAARKALLTELGAVEWIGLRDADEKQARIRAPRSGRRKSY